MSTENVKVEVLGSEEQPKNPTVKMKVTIHQRGLSYNKKINGHEVTINCPETNLKTIEVESLGKVPNYVGLTNKFVGELAEFIEQTKNTSGINAKAGFHFETEIESSEENFNFKASTKIKTSNLSELAKSFALFISGANFKEIDYIEGTMYVGVGTEQVLKRILGDKEGAKLVEGQRAVPIQTALKTHSKMQREKDKVLLSNINIALLERNPTLIPSYRAKEQNKVDAANLALTLATEKMETLKQELAESGAEHSSGAIGEQETIINKAKESLRKAEAKLASFNRIFPEVSETVTA